MAVTEEAKKVEFHVVKKGYVTEEVDEYIRILSYEYEQVLEELRIEKERYKDLEEENAELRQKVKKASQSSTSSAEKEAITSLLIKAELIAKDIRADAEKEARQEREKAREELDQLYRTKQEVLADLQKLGLMIQQLTDGLRR